MDSNALQPATMQPAWPHAATQDPDFDERDYMRFVRVTNKDGDEIPFEYLADQIAVELDIYTRHAEYLAEAVDATISIRRLHITLESALELARKIDNLACALPVPVIAEPEGDFGGDYGDGPEPF